MATQRSAGTAGEAAGTTQAFVGKVAVITGGSRGLGLAIATALAANGADVVVASRKEDRCRAVAGELRQRFGGDHRGIRYHAASWGDADELFREVATGYGQCDVLVNCAGMSPRYGEMSSVSEELFDKTWCVNFKGPFRLGALFAEAMMDGRGGSIINVSSTSALQPNGHELVYAGAKLALHALTAGMARRFGPRVRVNTIIPGPFETDISRGWDPDQLASTIGRLPMGRVGQPTEVVGAALFLASDSSSYVSGSTLRLDGGLLSTSF